MCSAGLDLVGVDAWMIWSGPHLGAWAVVLVRGRVADVRDDVETERRQVMERAGGVLDVYLQGAS